MKHVLATLALAVLFLTASCVTTGIKPMESGVQVESSEPVYLSKERGMGQTVCVFFGDNSGHGLDLRGRIEAGLAAKGLQVVSNPDQADYVVDARMTYLGYAKDYPDQPVAGRLLSTTAGAIGGGLIGNNNGGSDGALVGGAVGGVVGLLVGMAIDKANTPDLYVGELHLLVKERLTFLGELPDERPIVSTERKTVTKTAGGKTSVVETTTEKAKTKSPTETTIATAQSGKGNFKTTTQTKVADWESHQTTFQGKVKAVRTDQAACVTQLSDYFVGAVVGVF